MWGIQFEWVAVLVLLFLIAFLGLVWVVDRWDQKRMRVRQATAERVIKSGFDSSALAEFVDSRHAPSGSLRESFVEGLVWCREGSHLRRDFVGVCCLLEVEKG